MRRHKIHHKNDVLVEDGWHIVRNERNYGMGGKNKQYIYFMVYHAHTGYPSTSGTHYTGLCTTERTGMYDNGTWQWTCTNCRSHAPDVVSGYMNLIEWSMNDGRT